MAGNFTRQQYDLEAYEEKIKRSTDPGTYRLDTNFAVNCGKCFAPYGPRNGQEVSDAIGNQIDVESVIRGYSKINSKSNEQQLPDDLSRYHTTALPNCSNRLDFEYTRLTYPAYEIRGLNVPDMRLDYPLFDPQCQIFEPFAMNTQLKAKDEHRAIWQVPFNMRDLLPVERLGKVKSCQVQMNCNYAPFDPY